MKYYEIEEQFSARFILIYFASTNCRKLYTFLNCEAHKQQARMHLDESVSS